MSNVFNNRKRPFGATFRTLNDITNNSPSSGDIGENDVGNGDSKKIAVHHIPSLTNDKEAAAILRKIHSEFHTIIERRGWNVISITEMCCCGDGVDCLKKGRKTKTMPDNVLGFNLTTWQRGKSHAIHLRLRNPRSHTLLPYEDIAGTMCHELAHCVRGPHDAKFYKAMEEIEEQYAVYLAKGVVVDKDGFPIGSSESHVLGSSSGGRGASGRSKNNSALADRRKALEAAESRQKKHSNGLTHGHVLGGKSSSSSSIKDPREAARIAAERRLLDSQYCLPCNEIIEILGEEEEGDSEVEVLEDPVKNTKKAARTGIMIAERGADTQEVNSDIDDSALVMKPKAKTSSSDGIIDLTLDDSFTTPMSPVAALKPPSKSKYKNSSNYATHPDTGQSKWTCPRCTLCNPPMILVCDACRLERPCNKTVLEQAKEFKKEDDIAYIKEREVQQSKETFGGFNIYGQKNVDSSSTMKHLT